MDDPINDEPLKVGNFFRLAWFFYLFLAITAVLWIGYSQGEIPLELFLNLEGWWIDLLVGVLAGAILLIVWNTGRHLEAAQELEKALSEQIDGINKQECVALAIISGFSEEIFFRGAMQSSWGWVPSVIFFTILHTGPGRFFRVWTAFAFLAALIFSGLTIYRENVMAATVAHILVNAINLVRLAKMKPDNT